MWGKLLRDLLEFEESLVFGMGHIGLVDMPFNFRILDDHPIREWPIPYPQWEWAWLTAIVSSNVSWGYYMRSNEALSQTWCL